MGVWYRCCPHRYRRLYILYPFESDQVSTRRRHKDTKRSIRQTAQTGSATPIIVFFPANLVSSCHRPRSLLFYMFSFKGDYLRVNYGSGPPLISLPPPQYHIPPSTSSLHQRRHASHSQKTNRTHGTSFFDYSSTLSTLTTKRRGILLRRTTTDL